MHGAAPSSAEGPAARLPRGGVRLRGERALQLGERGLSWLERGVDRLLPPELNPLAQTGAVATLSFLVATVSGLVLLIWYRSSVHDAYDSVVAMGSAPFTAGFVRSLHRYSSDACMLFTLVHALKMGLARKVAGARWLAWVTGVLAVGVMWLIGWTGYWLVWDQRAQQVAVDSAKMVDAVGLLTEPLTRSFLTDQSTSSLFFFMVFFVHMLVPLGLALLLWLHIVRLSRARFLTRGLMTAWVLVSLVAVSVLLPADVAARAQMDTYPDRFTIDAWYLAPLWLSSRLTGGLLWAISLGFGATLISLPWTLRRRTEAPAVVDAERCNACKQCVADCPYGAIRMVPRTDERPFSGRALVDPDRCVSCGICVGSCDSGAMSLPALSRPAVQRALEQELREEPSFVAFVCSESAGSQLQGDDSLPGYRVTRVPCLGWVYALTVERALRKGAHGVLMVGCTEGRCSYREGMQWTNDRIAGERSPRLRREKIDPLRVRVHTFDPGQLRALQQAAEEFRSGLSTPTPRASPPRRYAGLGIAAVACVTLIFLPSDVPFVAPVHADSGLVVSFNHPGKLAEACRERTQEELAKLPPHMRLPKVCERKRHPVALRLWLDGTLVHEGRYQPGGLSEDGNSVAIEERSVTPGEHHVRLELHDADESEPWQWRDERRLTFEPGRRRVVLFNRDKGFLWH